MDKESWILKLVLGEIEPGKDLEKGREKGILDPKTGTRRTGAGKLLKES